MNTDDVQLLLNIRGILHAKETEGAYYSDWDKEQVAAFDEAFGHLRDSLMKNEGWIPVSERPAPITGACIILSERGAVAPMINNCIQNEACDYRYGDKITHWQPLPPPPTAPEGRH